MVDVVKGGLTADQTGRQNQTRDDADAHADREVHVGNASCNRCEYFVVYFAGASCRSGRDAPRTSTAESKRRQHNTSDFTTTHKHSLSGADFPPTRNVASASDLKPVPVVSSETNNPHQILPSNPILSPTTVARRIQVECRLKPDDRTQHCSIGFELDLVVAAGVVEFDIDQVHVGGFFE